MFYAKSNPVESIKEHTDGLIENLGLLKSTYGKQITRNLEIDEERFWYLLKIVCIYHDFGKVFTPFQNLVREKIDKPKLETEFSYSIKHEKLSPMFVPVEKLGLTTQEKKLVYQVIFYHHERDDIDFSNELVSEIIQKDIKPNLEKIKLDLEYDIEDQLNNRYGAYIKPRIKKGDSNYKLYCMLKGLLHRLDHSSSAHIDVEDDTKENIAIYTNNFIESKYSKKRELQQFTYENQDKNLLIVGSTGIGKTEGALLWSGGEKTFFTLPIRTSINAIYDRIQNDIKYEHVGLLHSTALDYLEENTELENAYSVVEQSRNLAQKITTCTIDQIFTFVFKFKGYEKIYSTLKYSKIIIDEIQGYSPEIVAIILKGIQMISQIGGKFMIMTATLPRIYREELEKMGIEFEYKEFIKDIKRHRIKLINTSIIDNLNELKYKANDKKILVIVNTVDRAIEVFEKLKNSGVENVNLLHSRFIDKDKNEKEKEIKNFSNNKIKNGIWISTQIVEASLDIDFDELHTELSTLDSLFQRFGRCYRNRVYENDDPNVYIYTEDVSGEKYVYDEEIMNNSLKLLQKYDGKILTERQKIDLVDKLYSREMLEETNFYKKFKDGLNVLDNIVDYDNSKADAQKLLRNIDNINIIPKCVYDENLDLFKQYEAANKENNYEERNKLRREITKLTVSVRNPKYNNGRKQYITPNPYIDDLYIGDFEYTKDVGLKFNGSDEYNVDSRMF